MHPLTLTCRGRMCFPPPPPLLEFIYLFIFPLLLLNLIYMRQQLSFPAHISSGRKGRHFALIDVDKRRFGSCSRYLGLVSYIDGGLVHHKWTACWPHHDILIGIWSRMRIMLALHSKKKNKTDTDIISTQFILSLSLFLNREVATSSW